MHDLILINPVTLPYGRGKGLDSLSLGYLGSFIKSRGYSVKIVELQDYNSVGKLKLLTKHSSPALIGITSYTGWINSALELVRILKQITKTPIVLGGPHVSHCAESIMQRHKGVDYIIKGEGELKLKLLLDYVVKGKGKLEKVPGLVFRKEDSIMCVPGSLEVKQLDTLPPPERSADCYLTLFMCSRGCRNSCNNCLLGARKGHGLRWRSTRNIINEFKELKCKGLLRRVYFCDCSMNDVPERFIRVCKQLLKEGLVPPDNSQIYLRIKENPSRELLKWAGRIGVNWAFYGIESGSTEQRIKCGKFFSEEHIFNSINACTEFGITPCASFMTGIPGESEQTIKQTLRLMLKLLKAGCMVKVYSFKPFYGTGFYEHRHLYDFQVVEPDFDYWTEDHMIVRTKSLSEIELASITWSLRKIHQLFSIASRHGTLQRILKQTPQGVFEFLFFLARRLHKLLKAMFRMKGTRITLVGSYLPPQLTPDSLMKDANR